MSCTKSLASAWLAAALIVGCSGCTTQVAPPAAKDATDHHHDSAEVAAAEKPARHPLDPLDPDEIRAAVAGLRKNGGLSEGIRFVSIALKEPDKATLTKFEDGAPIPREAQLVLLDHDSGASFEAVVNLADQSVGRVEKLPAGVQPSIMLDEFGECEEAAKASPEFRAALKKRGVEDMSLVMVDAWSSGHYGDERPEDDGRRLVRALSWVRKSASDEGYAHPIEGVVAVIDLNRKEVVRVEDYGVVPLPAEPGNWAGDYLPKQRAGLKPLEVVQPDGPSFTLTGHEVKWQKWNMRVGFSPREGLILHAISYDGRPVLAKASISEMVVPYGDPKRSAYHKNAFDMGEYGVGCMANSLALGCDCLGTIRYLDASMADSHGEVVTIKNAICLHEEDAGVLWKHSDWRNGAAEVRRSRRLAVSLIATVGNYDYGYYWYFYQDGSIQMEVKLSGIMNTQALAAGETSPYGTEIASQLQAPNHQHFFGARLDFDVDGKANTVYEVNTHSVPAGEGNPVGNAFATEATELATESKAQRNTNAATARFWRIVNPEHKNSLGAPTGYRLCPGENTPPMAEASAPIRARAGFLASNLWVTPYSPSERYQAGEYPNQSRGGDGLPTWTKGDRSVADADLVVWYTFGHTHVPRAEDWPVMPVAALGFMMRPDGFFTTNPALDVAPPMH